MNQRTGNIFSPFFGLIGIGLLIGGAWIAAGNLDLAVNGMRASGTVVELQRGCCPSRGNRAYYPVVRFRTENSGSVEFRSHVGNRRSLYSVGERVKVVYDPEYPERARIASKGSLWTSPLSVLLGGAIFTAAGVWMWRNRARPRPRRR